MSSPCAHPLVPSRRRREDPPSAAVPLPPSVLPSRVAGTGEQEVVVLDSSPSPPTPVVSAKRRRGGGSAGSSQSSAFEDSSPDVVVVGEHRRGARGGDGGPATDWRSATSSEAPPAGRSWQSRAGWSAGGGALTAESHAPAVAVASMEGVAQRPRLTTAAASTARQVANDEVVARSLAVEMTAAAGPGNGAHANRAVGPAARFGGENIRSTSASLRWRPPNAAAWGSLVPAGQGGSRVGAAAGASSLALRAAQMRGRRVAGPGLLRGSQHAAAMEMMLAIARESAMAGGIGHGQGGVGGFDGGGGYDGGGYGGGGGGGSGGVGGGGWPPLVREGEDEYTALLRLDDAVDSGRLACPPHVLARLPTTTVGQDGERGIGAGGSSSCCICMETIVTGDVVRRLPCCHLYHSHCINQWLGVKGVCPVDQRVVKDMIGS
ncbi:hypothetical protein MMPV_006204 [Pyropia vietnamensis]